TPLSFTSVWLPSLTYLCASASESGAHTIPPSCARPGLAKLRPRMTAANNGFIALPPRLTSFVSYNECDGLSLMRIKFPQLALRGPQRVRALSRCPRATLTLEIKFRLGGR